MLFGSGNSSISATNASVLLLPLQSRAAKTGAEIGPRVGMQFHSLQGLGVGVLQGPAFVPLILHVTEVQIPFEGPEKG
jgi:hypothetical protein